MGIEALNELDEQGNPTGGRVVGVGLVVNWQNGVLGRPPQQQNGAFVDDLIEASIQRLRFYQDVLNKKFACRENALAITHLEEALHWLQARRVEREARGVQGLHVP